MAEYIDRNLIEWYGCDFENDSCKNRECSGCDHAECSHSQVMGIPSANVIEIPKGATNGDMIMALFPNAEFSNTMPFTDGRWEVMNLDTENRTREIYRPTVLRTYADWWDAPYKKEGDGNANGNN